VVITIPVTSRSGDAAHQIRSSSISAASDSWADMNEADHHTGRVPILGVVVIHLATIYLTRHIRVVLCPPSTGDSAETSRDIQTNRIRRCCALLIAVEVNYSAGSRMLGESEASRSIRINQIGFPLGGSPRARASKQCGKSFLAI
jgi:hypothetical protein